MPTDTLAPRPSRRLGLAEMFGLTPLSERLPQLAMVFRGDPYTPPSRFDRTSLRALMPGLSLRTWAGQRRPDRLIPLYNLFNHTPTPVEDGWSVRVTQVRDFRGGTQTYDSHNGTDFAIPVGTVVTAAAPGVVLRVSNEFHRGGLKVLIDHGHGVVTTSNHLGRALVRPGDRVARGQPVALSGASGVDMVAAFPWNTPHVHYNTWLNGEPVDPFAVVGATPAEAALWRDGNAPRTWTGPPDADFPDSDWDPDGVDAAIAACRDPALRATLSAHPELAVRATAVMFHRNYFPTRFTARPPLYRSVHPRAPLLTLPFSAADFDGVAPLT